MTCNIDFFGHKNPASSTTKGELSFRIPTVPLAGASLASAYPNMSAVPVEEVVKDETDVGNLLNNPAKL